MSKKIASGTKALVLDVKTGSGAFMDTPERARELAETMVGIGGANGVRTVALLTDMDQPLGLAAGNAIEVAESLECLRGGGPDDLRAITLALASEMLALAGVDADPAAALDDGRALATFEAMIEAQGGDLSVPLAVAPQRVAVRADRSGFVRRLDCKRIGVAVWRLGAGRALKEDPVSMAAGIVCQAKVGAEIRAGDPVLELHVDDPSKLDAALAALDGAIEVADTPAPARPLVVDRIT